MLVFLLAELPAAGVVLSLAVALLALTVAGAVIRTQLLDVVGGAVGAEVVVAGLHHAGRTPFATFQLEGGESTLDLYLTPRAAERLRAGDQVSITYYPASRRVASIRWK